MASRHEVKCVNKTDRQNPHERSIFENVRPEKVGKAAYLQLAVVAEMPAGIELSVTTDYQFFHVISSKMTK